ncbi:Scd6-like Sm domain-containing protein [Crucibulum laeve]|uniref:Scd6-like Sm domain-containing protein n=1 Tax=Crucibulum laeve TaxID=68775 RepID=A0A5C3LTA9_9AGAR|nr:Scd6-like Sm domain-containing protein [Crucibulum laeve]
MALSFIGKPISLISHSDVRYRGILAGIDPGASTIQLSNVYSMGTESRRPPAEFIPPNQEPYAYIIFRASEVKDLAVDENTPRRSVHDDPAVLGASAPAAPYQSYPPGTNTQPPPQQQQPPPQQGYPAQQAPSAAPQQAQQPSQAAAEAVGQGQQRSQPQQRRSNSVHTAAASLETVERAIGDLRVAGTAHHPNTGRGGSARRGREPREQIKVPNTDFDFQTMNAKFDKASLTPAGTGKEEEGTSAEEGESTEEKKNAEEKKPAYNPQKSFFDSLSSSSGAPAPADGAQPTGGYDGGGRGRRGGGGAALGRNRREEERERNVATFGEPGGVGLMGPGAYVGGWGGYGRRGGRGRRGGGAGQGAGRGGQPVQART